jgi:hypothetical protein
MKSTVIGPIAAVVLTITAATSHASTNVVELNGIQFALTDLNLGDGIDPDYLPDTLSASGYLTNLNGQGMSGPGIVADGFLTAGDINAAEPNASVSGSMSPSHAIAVEADATAPGTAEIDGSASLSMSLTPYTSLTLTADSLFQAFGGAGFESASICLDTVCSSFRSAAGGTQSHAYSVTFSNDSAQYTTGLLATVDVSAFASSVPELPASALLLAASALFIGRRSRRTSRLD